MMKDKLGIDVDLLDGNHSTAFQAAGNELSALQALSDSAGYIYKSGDGAYAIQTPSVGAAVADLTGTAMAVGDSATVGVAATAARSDHKHAFTNPKIDDLSAADDNTDLNASTTAHGLLIKAVAPAATMISVVGIGNGETIYSLKALFDATVPAALGTAAVGSSTSVARRDHVHTLPALDAMAAATDITTANASTTAHGLLLKATAPAAGLINVVGIANGETAYTCKALFDATTPADVSMSAAAVGTAVAAARRDHVHLLADAAVTYAKMQHVSATDMVLGRSTAGSGDVEEIACTLYGRNLIAAASLAAQKTILGIDNSSYQTMTQKTGQTVNTNWAAFDPTSSGVTLVDGGVYAFKIKVTGTTTTTIIEAVGMFVWKTAGSGAAANNELLLHTVSQTAGATADLKIFVRQITAGTGAAWTLQLAADSDLGATAKIDAIFHRIL
jgi:hypothetical protein